MTAKVVVPSSSRHTRRLAVDKIHSIICNRVKNGDEQYLVRWHTKKESPAPPLSWHHINELRCCLEHVQDYLEVREKYKTSFVQSLVQSRKRKSSDVGTEIERRLSPFDRRLQREGQTPSATRSSSSSASITPIPAVNLEAYNGVLELDANSAVFYRHTSNPDTQPVSVTDILTTETKQAAYQSRVTDAEIHIRLTYAQKLKAIRGPQVVLFNDVDATTPPLRFQYIDDYNLAKDVVQFPPDTATGCQQCSPRMGRDIGCEYTQKCDCLEYAAVDEGRLNAEQLQEYERCMAEGKSTLGLPKKFPYFAKGTKIRRTGALVPFYLNSRAPIYECNDRCRCGPDCRNKNVQFGRRVEFEIFKTRGSKGWGLRCKQNLHQGQFIDTYRGEVITDEEADRREQSSSKSKASYLYSLDKFEETEDLEHKPYVVDGEFMGGPSKFINHSCDPNCRQYTVSYNKDDPYIYDIAFFACRDIPAGVELTFDYLDKEEEEEMGDAGQDAVPCLCGAAKCRKWLWT